jgi:pimeloyl-ACP methyl ester carboxylesterase
VQDELWTPQLEDIILHIVQLRDDDTVAPRLDFDNHLQIIGAMWDQPTFDLYRQVTCPITLIVAEQGTSDPSREAFLRMRREGVARIQALRPDIHIVLMSNTIHDIPLQRPARLAEEINNAWRGQAEITSP